MPQVYTTSVESSIVKSKCDRHALPMAGGSPLGTPAMGAGFGGGTSIASESTNEGSFAAEVASLGSLANKCHTLDLSGFAAGRKILRSALQSSSRYSLSKLPGNSKLRGKKGMLRIQHCKSTPAHGALSIDIYKRNDAEDFHYRNLQSCGSVWLCSLCAPPISERRKLELQEATATWKKTGNQVLFLTLTVPHYSFQSSEFVLKSISKSYRSFFNGRTWNKKISAAIGYKGRIRALEVTFGDNGWHPHFHVLLFNNQSLFDEELIGLQEMMLDEWKLACKRSGLSEPNEHGLTLQNDTYSAEYVSKWGMEHEMVKGHIKKARDGYTPWDLLRVMVGTYDGTGTPLTPEQASSLFREYAEAFHGRRQLEWSRGLRKSLNMGKEVTDEEIAEENDSNSHLFLSIPLEVWKFVLREDCRGELLEICMRGEDYALVYLMEICSRHGYDLQM